MRVLAAAFVVAFCASFAVSPALSQEPDGCYPVPAPLPDHFSDRPAIDLIEQQLLYYRCMQYDADVAAVLKKAQRWVTKRAPQVHNPAIVLDIDETALSNWTRIYRDGFKYIESGPCHLEKSDEACGELKWERSERAPAIQPTLDLYNLARCYRVAPPCTTMVEVFFVTGRKDSDQKIDGKKPVEWTYENLQKAGYLGLNLDHLFMRPENSTGPVELFKKAKRIEIENHFNVTIIANVGDQNSDLIGGHAERTFKVPNPFYFIP
jgi:hypothetical protein